MPPKKHRHLTPEERREIRKQKKLDRKLKLAEKKRQLKRDHLERETKYGVLTYKRHEKEWRRMLIKVALPRMRQDLEFAWHNFERVMDCKDFTISLLKDELKDAEDQYMLNFQAHAENMEKLMEMFYDRLEELKKDYLKEVRQMEERFDNEYQDIKDVSNENLEFLKTMQYRLEIEKKEHIRTKRGEYFSRLDEVDAKNQLLLQKLKATLETKYQHMFEDIQHFIINYNKQIKDRKKEHNELKEQDEVVQGLIAQQFRQIKKFYDIIRELKQKYVDMKQTDGSRLLDLQAERQYFSNSFLTLKNKLADDMKDDFNKLVLLSEHCAAAFNFLESLNKRGDVILTLTAVCRKLETQKEKILPFPRSLTGLADVSDKERIEREIKTERVEGVRPEMELFWQRLGQAYCVQYILSREKKFLSQENELLVDTHNEYCEKLKYPPVHSYKATISIPKTDINDEIKKYADEHDIMHRLFMYRSVSRILD